MLSFWVGVAVVGCNLREEAGVRRECSRWCVAEQGTAPPHTWLAEQFLCRLLLFGILWPLLN